MNNRTRNLLKLVALVIVVVMVLMHIGTIAIPVLNPYKFWLMVVAFGMVIISTK